jgi:senataxin
MDDQPTPAQVEAVLKSARSKTQPQNSDLLPVYKFVLPPKADPPLTNSTSSEGSSSSHENGRVNHFYCEKNPSDLRREGAIYLIFLFAYKREGMPKIFLDELERVLKGCTSCARAFGGARRRFAKL